MTQASEPNASPDARPLIAVDETVAEPKIRFFAEDLIAFAVFWVLAAVVFLQFLQVVGRHMLVLLVMGDLVGGGRPDTGRGISRRASTYTPPGVFLKLGSRRGRRHLEPPRGDTRAEIRRGVYSSDL